MMGTKIKEPIVDTKDPNLSKEFKDEIIKERKHRNWPAIISVSIISVIMLVVLGIGAYQIFYKKDVTETTEPTEKIQSVPKEDTTPTNTTNQNNSTQTTQPVTETPQTTTPTTAATYTVVEGDTLGAIATKFNTTSEALMSLNGITDETSLQIGQTLKLK